MEYVSPADAFSSSLEHSLLVRQEQQHRAQQDQLALQREVRAARIQDEERQQAKEALAEKRAEFTESQKDKRKAAFEKTVSGMLEGDIASPDLLAESKEFHLGHLFPESQPQPAPLPPPTPAPITDVPSASDSGMAPMGTVDNPAPTPTMTGGGFRFIGTAKERQQKETDVKVAAIQKKLSTAEPGSPEERAAILEYELTTNKTVPAGMLKSAKPRLIFDPVKREYSDPSGARVTDIPEGASVDRAAEPRPPKDTTAHDIQRENQRNQVYNHVDTILNKIALPYESKLGELDAVDGLINERSVTADAHIAPKLLSAVVAGTGSGFRMTKSEIEQVQNARTKWQSMQAAFRKWEADPKDALFFDDAQRKEFSNLVQMMRRVTERHLEPIGRARQDIDVADNPRDIQKRMSAMHEERSKNDTADTPAAAAAPKRIRVDINGKPVSK